MKYSQKNNDDGLKNNSKRLREIIGVLRKHHVVKNFNPVTLRFILEDLGPTFIKIGQIMSMRHDVLPKEYCLELEKLRSDVKQMSYEEALGVVEAELGTDIYKVFKEIDVKPLGSASIAQVHKALLLNGKKVVIKIQRPGIDRILMEDIDLLRKAVFTFEKIKGNSSFIDLQGILTEMRNVTIEELDFLAEVNNLKEFYRLNKEINYIDCPKVFEEYTSSKIIVMEYIDGHPVDDIDTLIKQGNDMNEIGNKIAGNYVKQVIEDGFFHADPHPGNIQIKDGKIIWIDLGMVGKLTKRDIRLMKNAAIAFVNKDISSLENFIIAIGNYRRNLDYVKLYNDIDEMMMRYSDLDVSSMNMGKLFNEIMDIAKFHNISIQPNFTLLSRGILTIEGVIEKCSPDISLIKILSSEVSSGIFDNIDITNETKTVILNSLKSMKNSSEIINQSSELLKRTLKGQMKLNVSVKDSDDLIAKINGMVDKLVLALIFFALIIGTSIICLTDMKPQIFNIPLLGAIGFLISSILGIYLVYNIAKKKY